jgi:hypothetical protein
MPNIALTESWVEALGMGMCSIVTVYNEQLASPDAVLTLVRLGARFQTASLLRFVVSTLVDPPTPLTESSIFPHTKSYALPASVYPKASTFAATWNVIFITGFADEIVEFAEFVRERRPRRTWNELKKAETEEREREEEAVSTTFSITKWR